MRKDQQREIEAWKAAKRANTLRRSIDEAVQETARKSPRKLNPKEELERQNRLEKLEKWKREKEMKKREDQLRFDSFTKKTLSQAKKTQKGASRIRIVFDSIFRTQREIEAEQKRRVEEARDRERILKLREIEREHRKQSEKLIKEAEEREMKEERRRKAHEVNQRIKEVTAKDIYARQIEGKGHNPIMSQIARQNCRTFVDHTNNSIIQCDENVRRCCPAPNPDQT